MGGGTMMAISVNTARSLYWKGRYLQRAQTMLRELLIGYDNVIDRDFDSGRHHYEKLGVVIDYKNANDFLRQGMYGKYDSSIVSIIAMARENAIETRNLLDERGFARLNQIHNRLLAECGKVVTPLMLEDFVDDLAFILGIFSSELERSDPYLLIRLGQQVERFDLILRLHGEVDMTSPDIDALHSMAKRLNPHYKPAVLEERCIGKEELLHCVNSVIDRVIEEFQCQVEFTQEQKQKK
jgi:uncharacterized alpha-E superfamily protein